MASFNGNIDLLSLNQAQVLTGIDQKNPSRPYVCIPLDMNEIKYEASRATVPSVSAEAPKMVAKLRVNIWPFAEAYKDAIRRRAAERGDSTASVPTHEMQINFSTDYIKSIIKAYPRLVEQVKEANKERTPDIVNQDPLDENSALFRAIQRRMNKRIASLYQPQPKVQQNSAAPAISTFQGQASAYVPPAEGEGFNMEAYTDPNSDLPF